MGIWKKMGKAVGGAIVKTGKWTAASIKKKNLQNRVERRILDRFKKNQLKRMIKEYHLSGPELPERGYYKKSDYVDYAYRHFKLKTVIQWAKKHNIPIGDIMEDYKREMEAIERQYGVSKESKEEDRKHGVEEIEVESEEFESPQIKNYGHSSEVSSKRSYYDETFEIILREIENYDRVIRNMRKITDEREFQNILIGFLNAKFPDFEIIQKVDWRADILINGKYALELKYADNSSTMDKGIREIKDYKKHTPYVAMIILDVGDLHPETLRRYIEYYEEEGAKVVVLHGKGGRRKKKVREIRVRY